MTDPRGPQWRVPFSSGHACGWPGCDEEVSGRIWACKAHWLRLPVEIRDRLMAQTQTPGPENSRIRSPLFPIAEAEALAWIEDNKNGDS